MGVGLSSSRMALAAMLRNGSGEGGKGECGSRGLNS